MEEAERNLRRRPHPPPATRAALHPYRAQLPREEGGTAL
jgi:hypothetical protein